MPDEDDVSRWVFYPHMTNNERELIWSGVFMFSNNRPESVVWRKYLEQIQQVHDHGCIREEFVNRSRRLESKPVLRYEGALTAQVGRIRRIRSLNNYKFCVVHDPSGGQGIYHAHIAYDVGPDQSLTKHDKIELKSLLKDVFSDLAMYSCERNDKI